jgi:hypothetical protein
MRTMAQIYIPLLRRWERPQVKIPKFNMLGVARSFGDAIELYRRALSATYVTALCLDQPNEAIADEDVEGRDPRW